MIVLPRVALGVASSSSAKKSRFDIRTFSAFAYLSNKSIDTDLEAFSPEIRSSTFYPGDVAEISAEGAKIHRQQTDLVTRQEDEIFRTAFNPVYEVPRIRTLTEDPELRVKEKEAVIRFIEDGTLLDKLSQSESMAAYRHWGIGYRLNYSTRIAPIYGASISARIRQFRKDILGRSIFTRESVIPSFIV